MRPPKYMNLRVGDKSEIKEILVADIATNRGIPGGSYVPVIRMIVITNDGRAYSGEVYFEDLISQLKQVQSAALTKLLKKCEIDT